MYNVVAVLGSSSSNST